MAKIMTEVTEEVKKAPKVTRKLYSLKEGTKLTEVPKNFDFAKHLRIKKGFFKYEHTCLAHRADEAKWKEVNAPKKTGEKKERKAREDTRQVYPLKEGAKLTEIPADFDFDKHCRIKKNFFEQEHTCLEHRADEAQWMVNHLRQKAKQMKELGGTKNRNRMSRLQKMQAQMEELKKELETAGVDVDGLLES